MTLKLRMRKSLSRLSGGESGQVALFHFLHPLSRLSGGEQKRSAQALCPKSLSRLPGGESLEVQPKFNYREELASQKHKNHPFTQDPPLDQQYRQPFRK